MMPPVFTLQISCSCTSAIYRLPLLSLVMRKGAPSCAAVAGPPLPVNPMPPLPTAVLMMPAVFTLRTTALYQSVMYRLPFVSTTASIGLLRVAAVAGPPSPVYPVVPVPATVLMIPDVFTFLTQLKLWSTIYRLPVLSSARPYTVPIVAAVAGPPSPVYENTPVPAIVVIKPDGSTLRTRFPLASAI